MKKKLAIVNHNLGSGGAEKLIYDMALELKKINFNFSIILLTSVNDIYGKKLQEVGIEVIYLSDKWDIYSPKNIFRLKKILKNYDIIHTHTYAAQLWVAFTSLFLNKNKKYITTEHSTNNRRREKLYFKYLDKWMYNKYNTIISITEATQNNLLRWIENKKSKKYQIISNGIDLERFIKSSRKERKEFNLNENDKLICQVARFTKIKNHETTIEALKLLPENYKVLFLGEGETKKNIEKLVKKYRLEKRVRFLGYRSDVPEIIKMCDLSVLTSKYEGHPISAIESMYLNPIIGSFVPGIKELLYGVGEVFEYMNYIELSNKILELMEEKDKYLLIKNQCKKRASDFNIKDTVFKYLEYYRD